jgi:hypothetical protein
LLLEHDTYGIALSGVVRLWPRARTAVASITVAAAGVSRKGGLNQGSTLMLRKRQPVRS